MSRDFDLLPGSVHQHVADQLLKQSWSDAEAMEFAGYLLFPAEIYRRKKDGSFERVQVALRVPRMHELRQARTQARAIARSQGLDPEADKDLLGDLENVCILAMALRSGTPPHEPYEPDPLALESKWEKASLVQLWNKLEALYQVIDPAPSSISENEMFVLLAKLAKERNLGPLAAYAPDARTFFIVTTAERLLILLAPKLLSEPSERSTQASSPSSA